MVLTCALGHTLVLPRGWQGFLDGLVCRAGVIGFGKFGCNRKLRPLRSEFQAAHAIGGLDSVLAMAPDGGKYALTALKVHEVEDAISEPVLRADLNVVVGLAWAPLPYMADPPFAASTVRKAVDVAARVYIEWRRSGSGHPRSRSR